MINSNAHPATRNGSAQRSRLLKRVSRPSVLLIVAIWAATALLHYVTPQGRALPGLSGAWLSRHAFERVLFIVPAIVACFAYGSRAGGITLVSAVLAMLPRALWLSPSRADALMETAMASVVGAVVVWGVAKMIRNQVIGERALERLHALNAVTTAVSESLDLDEVLASGLDKALEGLNLDVGAIYLVQNGSGTLKLAVTRGVLSDSCGPQANLAEEILSQMPLAAHPVVSDCCLGYPAEACAAGVAAGLHSEGTMRGVLVMGNLDRREFFPEELELVTATANQIAAAIENARLYEGVRAYARQIILAQEDERKRIARDIHDETIQALGTALRRAEYLATMVHDLPPGDVDARIASLQQLLSNTLRGTRRFVQELRPTTLDHLGLVAAIESLVENLAQGNGPIAILEVTAETRGICPEVELALFRIAQEALSNVRRHAEASHVDVRLSSLPDRVTMTIRDDGRGFEVGLTTDELASTTRLGLVGMRERAAIFGGTVMVRSKAGEGTTVRVEIPLTSALADQGERDRSR